MDTTTNLFTPAALRMRARGNMTLLAAANEGYSSSTFLHALLQLGSSSSFFFYQLFLSAVWETSSAAARYCGSSLLSPQMMIQSLGKEECKDLPLSLVVGCISTILEGSNLRTWLKFARGTTRAITAFHPYHCHMWVYTSNLQAIPKPHP